MPDIEDEERKARSLKLAPYVQEIKAALDENRVVDSLVEQLALHKMELADLRRAVSSLKAMTQMRDILLPEARQNYAGLRTARIDAGMPLKPEHSFYHLEYDGIGRPFRWTGPSRSFWFDLHVDRTLPLKFTLQLAKWSKAYTDRLRCLADQAEIVLIQRPSPASVVYTGILMPREVLGLTRLEFVAAKVFRPAVDVNDPAADKRLLGVVFQELTIEPAEEGEVRNYLQACDLLLEERAELAASLGGMEEIAVLPGAEEPRDDLAAAKEVAP